MPYTDVHRSFLQHMSGCNKMEKTLSQEVLKTIIEKSGVTLQNNSLDDVIKEINNKIKKFDQKIIIEKYEPLKKEFCLFIKTADTITDKFQSTYTPADLDYFRVLIKTIAVEDEYSINLIVALNLSNQVVIAKLPKQRAENLLDKWTLMGYFEKIDEQLFFGPKMQAEFPNFLKDKFPDSVQSCKLCNNILLWGISCHNCSMLVHNFCMRTYLARLDTCPGCKAKWETPLN